MKKILTIILDGFGMKEDVYGNAVKNAGMTNFINIWQNYPHSLLHCSEKKVGLPNDVAINSELSHKIIGAGRIVKSKYEITQEAINSNSFYTNNKYLKMIEYLKESGKNIHIVFLLSESLLNSNINDLKYITNSLLKQGVKNVYLHLITDGEDSSKFYGLSFFKKHNVDFNGAKFASVCGKYYAMDKTRDYTKTQVYYDLLVNSKGVKTPSIEKIIDICYNKKITDTYLPPIKTTNFIPIKNDDVVLFLNYGRDSQFQILNSLVNKDFDAFKTIDLNIKAYSLFEIRRKLNIDYLLKEEKVKNTLSEYLGVLGLTQARITEEIKEESLGYYLDGAREIEIDNCENYILKTNKIEYIEKKPEMKALNIARLAIKCMENDYDFVIANFANPDIIGHTGNFQASINALQAIDVCLGKIIEVAKDNFYKVIILGSHANCETIIDRNNKIITKNTLNKVPFIIMDKRVKLKGGDISSVVPTILTYMDINLPQEMKKTDILLEE